MSTTAAASRALPVFAVLACAVACAGCGAESASHAPPETPIGSLASELPPEAPRAAAPPVLRRSSVREAVKAGPARILQRVELDEQPVMVSGHFHGFRIVALKGDPAFWDGVDLRPGDVVTRLNGRSVERPQDAFDAFKALDAAPELVVDYERSGEARALRYPIVDDVSAPKPASSAAPGPAPASAPKATVAPAPAR